MYLADDVNDSDRSQHRNPYATLRRTRRPPPPQSTTSLDDSFDAVTMEAQTEWNVGTVHHGGDYEESITGYQNYVNEMERKMSREDDFQPPANKSIANTIGRATRNVFGSLASGKALRGSPGQRSSAGMATPDNARVVNERKAKVELVESPVKQDGPDRTISLWRERVADSSGSGSQAGNYVRSDANNHSQRTRSSGSGSHRRIRSEGLVGLYSNPPKNGDSRDPQAPRSNRVSFERTEYMVAYQHAGEAGIPTPVYARSERGSVIPLQPPAAATTPMSPGPQQMGQTRTISPADRRYAGPSSFDRYEHMITYPQTPPYSNASSGSLQGRGSTSRRQSSSAQSRRASVPVDMQDAARGPTASPVDLILASCDPSLLHISPVLAELGIRKVEHLRAVARLSEETRDREVKEEALKRGVTVVEWAILMDKLQTL